MVYLLDISWFLAATNAIVDLFCVDLGAGDSTCCCDVDNAQTGFLLVKYRATSIRAGYRSVWAARRGGTMVFSRVNVRGENWGVTPYVDNGT